MLWPEASIRIFAIRVAGAAAGEMREAAVVTSTASSWSRSIFLTAVSSKISAPASRAALISISSSGASMLNVGVPGSRPSVKTKSRGFGVVAKAEFGADIWGRGGGPGVRIRGRVPGSRGKLRGRMDSPMWKRGWRDFSRTQTRRPARARRRAATAPPGPPPMTMASYAVFSASGSGCGRRAMPSISTSKLGAAEIGLNHFELEIRGKGLRWIASEDRRLPARA